MFNEKEINVHVWWILYCFNLRLSSQCFYIITYFDLKRLEITFSLLKYTRDKKTLYINFLRKKSQGVKKIIVIILFVSFFLLLLQLLFLSLHIHIPTQSSFIFQFDEISLVCKVLYRTKFSPYICLCSENSELCK